MFSRIRASKVLCPHSLKLFTLSSSLHGSDTVGIFIDPDMGARTLVSACTQGTSETFLPQRSEMVAE